MKPVVSGGIQARLSAAVVNATPVVRSEGDERGERPISKEIGIQFIEVDPSNPRGLHLTWELVQRKEMEGLEPAVVAKIVDIRDFSKQIKKKGQLQPGLAYSVSSDRVELIEGERRYWALRLAGMPTMKLLVYSQKPKNIVDLRTLTNTERATYKLDALLRSLDQQELAYKDLNGKGWDDYNEMAEAVGLSTTRAFNLWKIRKGPEKVLKKALAGGFTSVEKAYEAAKAAEVKSKEPARVSPAAGEGGEKVKEETRGRRKVSLSMGDVRDWKEATRLVRLVAGDSSCDEVADGDFGALQKVWDKWRSGQ